MPSLFTKIIQGEIPSYKIYEDEWTYAFLDINPINLATLLLSLKLSMITSLMYQSHTTALSSRQLFLLGKAILKATGCKRIGSVVLGFDVPHFHYHLLPLWDSSDINFRKAKPRESHEMEGIQKLIVKQL